jgi:hypothetical protein
MRRFKTRQEFLAEYGETRNWNECMDGWFGLPYSGKVPASGNPYPELVSNNWGISDIHIIEKPHPYYNEEYVVHVGSPMESEKVQKKAFALGYTWNGERSLKYTGKAYLCFDDVTKLITYSDDASYIKKSSLPRLSVKQFMDADKLVNLRDLPPHMILKEGDHVNFDIKGTVLNYYVKTTGNRGWFLNRRGGLANSAVFGLLEISEKYHFVSQVLGYPIAREGDFPYVNSLSELGKVIEALQSRCKVINMESREAEEKVNYFGKFSVGDVVSSTAATAATVDTVDALSITLGMLKKEKPAEKSAIYKQPKTIQNGRSIKVQRQAPAVRSGEAIRGCAISGRAGKIAVRRRHLGHQTVVSRI